MSFEFEHIPQEFPALIAAETGDGSIHPAKGLWQAADLKTDWGGDTKLVEVELEYSCLNYKDALSATGNRGVSPHFPHIPGIDGYGRRLDSGEQIIITGFDFGMGTPGGFGRYALVPEDWLIGLPDSLTLRDAAAYGTAGVTAALCVDALLDAGVEPKSGPIAVSGATGGVGSISLAILSRLGFEVHAVTGKTEQSDWLKGLGASAVISREDFVSRAEKPMLRPEYAGAVDTVGAGMLHRLLRSISFGGAVAACGMVGGTELETNIFPFILRGVRLTGIASADSSRQKKRRMWEKLAGEWNVPALADNCVYSDLDGLPEHIGQILSGSLTGRVIVRL